MGRSQSYSGAIDAQRVSLTSDDFRGGNSSLKQSMAVIEEEKKVDGYIKASEVISLNTNNKHHFVVDSDKAPIDNDTEARRKAMRD